MIVILKQIPMCVCLLVQVLMGFLRPDTPLDELPLLIDFEAKSIAKQFPLAQERMTQL